MKPRQLGWKWLLLGLAVLMLAALAVVPQLFGDTSQFAKRIEAELSDWSGGKAELTGPVQLRLLPDVSVRGAFTLTGGTRLPLVKSITARDAKISLNLADLLLGRLTIDAVKLVRPRIVLETRTLPGTAQGEPKLLIDRLFAAGSVRVVHLVGGRIVIPMTGGTEIIKNLEAHVDGTDGAGAVSSFGSFEWRDETVRFSLDSGSLAQAGDSSTMPIALTLASKPITAKINGKAAFGSLVQLEGDTQMEIGDVRQFLNWVGVVLPQGKSLKALSAAGAFHLSGATLTFDDGAFSLDGNNAVGLLAVTGGARPRVEGTLAFDQLTLDPYLTGEATGTDTAAGASMVDQALLKHFDADLRVSAGAINAGTLKFGHGGFTVTAKAGVLAGELSELELCGGSASGQLGADLSQTNKRVTLMANLADVAIDSCLQQFELNIPFKGLSGVRTELAAEGRNMEELVHGLSGSLKVKASSGTVPVDLSRLITATALLEGEGWNLSGATPFDSLAADCRVASGHIWCQTFTMQTPRGIVSGSGDVDLPKQSLDWSLSVTSQAPKPATLVAADPPVPQVSIRGSLSQPKIRRADRPTLGEGSSQTGTLAPAVSPR